MINDKWIIMRENVVKRTVRQNNYQTKNCINKSAMKISFNYIIFFTLFLSMSCTSSAQKANTSPKVNSEAYAKKLSTLLSHTVNEISVDSASQLLKSIFLDNRSEKEYKVSHIQGALFAEYNLLAINVNALKNVNKNTPIIVYCSVGYRSEKTAEKLLKMGFTKVYNLYGGLFEWSNNNKPMVDENNNPTKKIHAYNESWGQWITSGEKVF